jgi:hypothetical protein
MIAGSIPAWSILLNTIGPEIELNVCAWDLQLSGPHSFNNFFNVVILARKAYHRPKPMTLGAGGDVLTQYIASTLLVLGQ